MISVLQYVFSCPVWWGPPELDLAGAAGIHLWHPSEGPGEGSGPGLPQSSQQQELDFQCGESKRYYPTYQWPRAGSHRGESSRWGKNIQTFTEVEIRFITGPEKEKKMNFELWNFALPVCGSGQEWNRSLKKEFCAFLQGTIVWRTILWRTIHFHYYRCNGSHIFFLWFLMIKMSLKIYYFWWATNVEQYFIKIHIFILTQPCLFQPDCLTVVW